MRQSAWKTSRVESQAYWLDRAYEAEVEFNQASSEEERQVAFDNWLRYQRLAGMEV